MVKGGRGWLRWRERDYVALHELPSALSHDPIIVRAEQVKRGRPFLKAIVWALVCVIVFVGLGVAALQAGLGNQFLADRAREALRQAAGDSVAASIGSAGIGLTRDGVISIEVSDVSLAPSDGGSAPTRAEMLRFKLDPFALTRGRMAVTEIELDGASVNFAAFGEGKGLDMTTLRIAALGEATDRIFGQLDSLAKTLGKGEASVVRLRNIQFPGSADSDAISIPELELTRDPTGRIKANGELAVGESLSPLSLTVEPQTIGGAPGTIKLNVEGLPTDRFLVQRDGNGTPKFGIVSKIDMDLTARRSGEDGPDISLNMRFAPGTFLADYTLADLHSGSIALEYRPKRRSIGILASSFTVGESTFPFTGGLIDLSNLPTLDGSGYGIELIFENAVSSPLDSDQSALPFGAKMFGRFLKDVKRFEFDEMVIDTPVGDVTGSLAVQLGGKSPQVSFAAQIERMRMDGIKQLWPYWIAKRPRQWLLDNVYGGQIRDAAVRVFIPQGRLAEKPDGLELGADQLQIDFEIERARVNVAGDIPPLRSGAGHMKLRGNRLDVTLASAKSYFPSGRSVDVADGLFTIKQTDAYPLMADLDIDVSGEADAIAEMISYKPIDALSRTPFEVEDFSGRVSAELKARFGLIRDQDPPAPDWVARFELDGVDVARQIEGRKFAAMTGTLDIDPQRAILKAKSDVDGVAMDLDIGEPIGEGGGVKEQTVRARVGTRDREKLVPGLGILLDGPSDIMLERVDETTQRVSLNLSDTKLMLPWIGWSKPPGVKAKASFTAVFDGGKTHIRDFFLVGDNNIHVEGKLTLQGSTVVSASMPVVRLSPVDDVAVSIAGKTGSYSVKVNGKTADLKPLIASSKPGANGGGESGDATFVRVEAAIDKVYGFGGETLSGLRAVFEGTGADTKTLQIKGVTTREAALVIDLKSDGTTKSMTVTTGDAGALGRLADIYDKLRGGTLSARIGKVGNGPYRGNVEIRDFAVVNEERIKSLVTSSAGGGGRSLREAAEKKIDVNVARFDRAAAFIEADGRSLKLANGIIRGPQIGSSLQGTVYDANGRIDITGTFMPAYGVNRIFGELPVVGLILGNGRDRGLIGITFRLVGAFDDPKLEVNPLSAIAPGVFRSIFEY